MQLWTKKLTTGQSLVLSALRPFNQLVLGVQLVLAGAQLPASFLRIEVKSLAILFEPVMASMWTCSSLAI